MPCSKICKFLDEIEKDDKYTNLKSDLLKEFNIKPESATGEAYNRVLRGVVDVLSKFDEFEDNVDPNIECFILIEDIATSGKCRYPWKIVKVLIILVYSKLFDEVYYSNKRSGERNILPASSRFSKLVNSPQSSKERAELDKRPEGEDEYRRIKLDSLIYVLEFKLPPFTLQRLCEITLKQPYRLFKKLFNAYRKLFAVRNIEYEPEQLPSFLNLGAFPKMDRVVLNLHKWERRYLATYRPEWNEELLSDNSEEADSSDDPRFKRPLE